MIMNKVDKIFTILHKDKDYPAARVGEIQTAHGVVQTPIFTPIGTRGSVKTVTSEELKFWGAQMILANTYHLWQRPGDTLIRKAGGLHKFMGWRGPILTDSGGFQVFSLGRRHWDGETEDDTGKPHPRVLSVTDAGVKFRSELDGSEHFLTPETSIHIQRNLGSDIALVLDEFPPYPATKEDTKSAIERTFLWAKRAKDEFEKLGKFAINPGQILYGIVQGGTFSDLRKLSADQILSLDFDGYAVGGVAVGEPAEKMYEAVEQSVPYLEEDKPRHLLGVGTPEQIIQAVARGMDTFDCVMPTRNARHGEFFVNLKAPHSGYSTLRITNAKYEEDFDPVDNTCNCYGCSNFSRAYIRHLFMAKEPLAQRLATMHNLRFYLNLMEQIRRAIEFGSFKEMVQNYRQQ